MAIQKKLFAVIGVADTVKMANQMTMVYPDAHISVGVGQWLVVDETTRTTTEVCAKLKITDSTDTPPGDTVGPAIVLSVANYFGRAPGAIWEWMAAKMGGSDAVAG